jgi:PAS domain S-box-containing protein
VTGYSREKLFKKNFRLLASSWTNPHIFDDIYNQLLSGKEWSGEIEKRRKSGDLVYENTTISPIFNENGRITHFLGISEDITEKKRVMQQLDEYRCHLEEMVEKRTSELERKTRELETKTIELEKAKNKAESADRLKSAFLANLSHELRTPLNSVIGFSSILLMGKTGDLNEEQRKQIKMIKTSGNHLLSLITDILDLSKIEAGQMNVSAELFDIQDTIEELHKIMLPQATGKGLSFIFERRPFSGVLKSDKQRVRQIIANLISNAIKFTNQGSVLVGCTRENNHLRIQVSDTGIGIKEDDFEKLFIPFIQIENDLIRKHPGSGLGLSISKKLAEMLNGSLGVESQFGSGSTFTLTLPVIVK